LHYGVQGNAALGHPLHDADGGYVLAPMSRGIRLTKGVEFAERDAPLNPIQLARDEPLARELFPLKGIGYPNGSNYVTGSPAPRGPQNCRNGMDTRPTSISKPPTKSSAAKKN
jgi:hypothetical protein